MLRLSFSASGTPCSGPTEAPDCPLPIGFPGRRADFVRLERDEGVEALVRRRARQQRIGQRFGLDLAGADRFRRLGHAKIMEFRHRRILYGCSPCRCGFPVPSQPAECMGARSGGDIGINVDQPQKARNNAGNANSASFPPLS